MLISIRHKFVLVAMPKCASTALETALKRHCDVSLGGSSSQLKHLPYSMFELHLMPLLRERLGDKAVCEPLSLFREPLEWLFSWYKYRTRPELVDADHRRQKNYSGNVSFAEFLNEHFSKRPAPFARMARQSSFVQNSRGQTDEVTLYRYEDIGALVRDLESRVGKSLALKIKNRSPERSFDMPEAQIREARRVLHREYEIYDAITLREGLAQPPAHEL
jgi:hypothetical protein